MGKLTDKRDKLIAARTEAEERRSEARFLAERKRNAVTVDAATPFAALKDDIDFKRPDAPTPDEQTDRLRGLTAELIKKVEQDGLVFTAVRSGTGWALIPVDPAVDADLEAAEQAAADALTALRDFERDNADKIAAERNKEVSDAMKAAIDAGDFEALDRARALSRDDDRSAAQRTADKLVSGEYEGWEDDTERSQNVLPPDGATTTVGFGGTVTRRSPVLR